MDISVIKIGGNIIDDSVKLEAFLTELSQLGEAFVLVHGGGKIATKTADKLGVITEMIEGRRITSEPMRDVVTMVYGGLINKTIVSFLQQKGQNAIGLSGPDAKLIEAQKRPVKDIDYGYVGDVTAINADFLHLLFSQNICPVVAPLSYSTTHGILNTNADTIAAELAKALSKNANVRLVYCFEKKGVLLDIADEDSVIPIIDTEKYAYLKNEKLVFEGMIPKIDNAFSAIDAGVAEVIICQAEEILNAIVNGTAGTKIIKHV